MTGATLARSAGKTWLRSQITLLMTIPGVDLSTVCELIGLTCAPMPEPPMLVVADDVPWVEFTIEKFPPDRRRERDYPTLKEGLRTPRIKRRQR